MSLNSLPLLPNDDKDGDFDDEQTWGSEPRVNKLVFIGKNLDKKELADAFEACLDIPSNQPKIDALLELKAKQQMSSAVIGAAHRDDLVKMKKLVDLGADINLGNSVGQTALHIASLWCNTKSVQYLLSVGARPNQTNRMGFAPLHT